VYDGGPTPELPHLPSIPRDPVATVNRDQIEGWKDLSKQAEAEKERPGLLALVQKVDRLLDAHGAWLRKNRYPFHDGDSKDVDSDGIA
jgi:hypothetical protein